MTAYTYDGEGQRVRKFVGENTRFVYGLDGQLIAEFDGSTGDLKKECLYVGATLITIEPTAVNSREWNASYTYDNNGNLLTRTDARGVVTTIAYDVLNRPTSKTDSDGTPNIAYFYDSQSLPAGAPAFNRGYSTGRLVAVT